MIFRNIPLALAILLVTVVAVESQQSLAQTADRIDTNGELVQIEANKGMLLRLDAPASDIFIANPEIADVQIKSPRLIYVYGVAPGETTLYALGQDDRPVYSASLMVTANLERLQAIYDAALPRDAQISVQVLNGMAVLTGVAPTAGVAEQAQRYAQAYLKTEIVNKLRISQPTQVSLRVKVAEVGRTTLKELGVNWEAFFDIGDASLGLFTGRDFLVDGVNPVTGLPEQQFLSSGSDSLLVQGQTSNVTLNAVLDALETEGLVSVLAEPNLTAVSGQTATFLAGGEFPVPIPQDIGQLGIQFKEFGVRLAFTPIVQSDRKISMRVAPEVSELTNAGAVNIEGISVPALSTRRVETTVELGSGQSFVIGGLLQTEIRQDVRKFPGLGDIPILGALFRSDAFRQNETELVVVATPYIVEPMDTRRVALPQDNMDIPSDIERYLHGETITYAPRTIDAAGAGREGPSLVGRAGFRLK